MSTGCQKINPDGIEDQQMLMSKIMSLYQTNAQKETVVYFNKKIIISDIDTYDVITYIECGLYDIDHDQYIPIQYGDVELFVVEPPCISKLPIISDICLPISLIQYNQIIISTTHDQLMYLRIKSTRLSRLEFDPLPIRIVLDDLFFKSNALVCGGTIGILDGYEFDHHFMDQDLSKVLSCTHEIFVKDHVYKLYSHECHSHLSYEQIMALLKRYPEVDGIENYQFGNESYDYCMKNQNSIDLYYKIPHDGSIIRAVKFNIQNALSKIFPIFKDPLCKPVTPCVVNFLTHEGKRRIFGGSYSGDIIEFSPHLMNTTEHSFFVVTVPINHFTNWSHVGTEILYGFLRESMVK